MKKKERLNIPFLILLLFGLCSNFFSQEKVKDFSILHVNLQVAKNIKSSELDDYWKESNAVGVSIYTPCYSGILNIGVTYRPFEAVTKNDSIPDFNSLLYFIGWEKSIYLTSRLSFSAGPNLGLFQMIFDETDEVNSSTDLYEHEVALGFSARLTCNISSKINFNTFVDYNRIMTNKRINMIYAGVCISYAIHTPGWLVGFLK